VELELLRGYVVMACPGWGSRPKTCLRWHQIGAVVRRRYNESAVSFTESRLSGGCVHPSQTDLQSGWEKMNPCTGVWISLFLSTVC